MFFTLLLFVVIALLTCTMAILNAIFVQKREKKCGMRGYEGVLLSKFSLYL